jgi:hypothetical protein
VYVGWRCDKIASMLCTSDIIEGLRIMFTSHHYQLIFDRITAATVTFTPGMLQRVWQEIDYCWDVCCITGGSCI